MNLETVRGRFWVALAGLLLLAFLNAGGAARCRCGSTLTACRNNLKTIATGLEMYSGDHGAYPDKLSRLTPNYLKTVPVCEERGAYEASLSSGAYRVRCRGGYHGPHVARGHSSTTESITGPGYPCYNSQEGLLDDPNVVTRVTLGARVEEKNRRRFHLGMIGCVLLLAFWFVLGRPDKRPTEFEV